MGEIAHLQALILRFEEIESICLKEAQTIARAAMARVKDPQDIYLDFEVEASVTAYLCEGSPGWTQDEDNILAERKYWLTQGESLFCDGKDWSMENELRIRGLGPTSWMFHDFHVHDYRSRHHPGREWRSQSVHDLLRIGRIWLDIRAIHQWEFSLSSLPQG